MLRLSVHMEEWPLERPFKISRFTQYTAKMAVVTLDDGRHLGRGECEVHATDHDAVLKGVDYAERFRTEIESGDITRCSLQELLPANPIRNAIDCAFWDLEAKQSGKPAWELAGLEAPKPVTTVYTISVDEPAIMGAQAAEHADAPILKLKLKGDGDLERVRAVHAVAPNARLIVDANQAWTPDHLKAFPAAFAELGVEMIEQPLPVGDDEFLRGFSSPIPIGADECFIDRSSLKSVISKYQFVNIKLDKTGGLTEALALLKEAQSHGLGIMVGCMVGTSLAMAPAMLVAQQATFVDLDGPLLLRADRTPGLNYEGSRISPPTPRIWG